MDITNEGGKEWEPVLYENKDIWNRIMDKGWRKAGLENYGEDDVANRLSPVDISNIANTWKYAKVNLELVRLIHQDLWSFRYRVFDWLGMLNTGRNLGFDNETQAQRFQAVALTKIFSDIYLLPTFTNVRLLGSFLEHEDFLEQILPQVKWEVESHGKRYRTMHFRAYTLPNRWGDPAQVVIPPQDWVISEKEYLH